MLRKAEAEYWKEQFSKSNSSREFWQTVNKMKGKSKPSNIQALKNDVGELVTNDSEKVELLNNHFADVGKKLASTFPSEDDENCMTHITRVTPTCECFESDTTHLAHQIAVLNPYKSMGADEIAPRELRAANNSILRGLKLVIDKSFEESRFPQSWKTAKLKSAFKKGSNVERENYRPLSLLSIPSKIQEGQICKTVDKHLDMNGATTFYQWGFKKGKSTEGLLLLMTETWKKAIDKGWIVGVLLIDFRKAFDSVSHTIMKAKLQGFGFTGKAYRILESYLDDRQQFVELNGTRSGMRDVSYGVPQGSLLGPRLFSMYINDLPDHITKGDVYLFADDTTFYYVGQNIEEVVDSLNEIGIEIKQWCEKNRLTIHSDKSEVMIITRQDFVGPLRPVKIGDSIIKYKNSVTSLGVTIDKHLKWDQQIKKVAKSYRAKMSQFRRMTYLPIAIQEEIYFKTVIAAVTYGIAVWGTCSQALMSQLERIHARAAKLIHKLPKNISDEDALLNANWDRLDYIYKRRMLTIMHKVCHGDCPEDFKQLFDKRCGRYARKNSLVVPRVATEQGRMSARFRGPNLWNQLPETLRSSYNQETFKRNIKMAKSAIKATSFQKEASLITFKQQDFIYY